ncbi:MAG: 50S ribosomal protein L1 [Patescibacteria group bacterium]
MSHGKRYLEAAKKIDANKVYSLDEALALAIVNAAEKIDSSIEIHCNLGIDPKKSDQLIRGTITLPHGTGQSKRVVAFVNPNQEADAKAAGADLVGGEELISEIKKTEKTDFDVAVATPDMMPKLAVVAKILGTRGLMPSPKNETVTANFKKAIEELKKGKVTFKNDDTANVHQVVGKVSFGQDKLTENINVFIEALRKAKPASSKGIYFQTVTVCSAMSPGIRVAIS